MHGGGGGGGVILDPVQCSHAGRMTGVIKDVTTATSPRLLLASGVCPHAGAAGTYHGETWYHPCACAMTTSCAELLCHSIHPLRRGRGFPHCYSQRLLLQETPVKRVMRSQCAAQHLPPPAASHCPYTTQLKLNCQCVCEMKLMFRYWRT